VGVEVAVVGGTWIIVCERRDGAIRILAAAAVDQVVVTHAIVACAHGARVVVVAHDPQLGIAQIRVLVVVALMIYAQVDGVRIVIVALGMRPAAGRLLVRDQGHHTRVDLEVAEFRGAVESIDAFVVRDAAIGEFQVGWVLTFMVDAQVQAAGIVVVAIGFVVAAARDLFVQAGSGVAIAENAHIRRAGYPVVTIVVLDTAARNKQVHAVGLNTLGFGAGVVVRKTVPRVTIARTGQRQDVHALIVLAVVDSGRQPVVPRPPGATRRVGPAAVGGVVLHEDTQFIDA